MEAIFFNEMKSIGLDYIKLISDDFLLKDNFEHYPHLMDDEEIFLDPFLIAHYHQPARTESQSLDQLLLGYIKKGKEPTSIEVKSDVNGAIYLSNIGYLLTHLSHTTFVLNITNDPAIEKYTLVFERKNIPFKFEHLRFVPDTNIEIFRHSHEYIIHKLGHDEHITDIYLETEPNELVDQYSETMIRACEMMRKVDPAQFMELQQLVKKVVFFRADRFVNFTSMDIQGIVFISTYTSAKELTFLDTLVHECAHLALYLILFDINSFFTVDPFELRFQSPFRTTLRSLYQSLHATFVLSKLVRFYNNCFKAELFSGIQKYELIGLLVLDIKLLGEAITYIGDRSLYTDEGWKVFEEIKKVYHQTCEERKDIISKYRPPEGDRNASVDPRDFEIDAFLKINNLTRAELVG